MDADGRRYGKETFFICVHRRDLRAKAFSCSLLHRVQREKISAKLPHADGLQCIAILARSVSPYGTGKRSADWNAGFLAGLDRTEPKPASPAATVWWERQVARAMLLVVCWKCHFSSSLSDLGRFNCCKSLIINNTSFCG